MAIIAPFKGLTYNVKRFNDLSLLMAPPYDVISLEEQEAFYRADPHNIIRLILGKKNRGDSDWDNRYTRAADYLKRWEAGDILIRESTPGIYLTSLSFDPGDGSGSRVRWGLIALVRIEEEDTGIILPHELTFSAHKDDRLKLMRACSAQLSQIFGLYEDPEKTVFNSFRPLIGRPPMISFQFKDGTSHELWAIRDEALLKKTSDFFYNKSIFIADGHHRYETSRNFRNILRARYGSRPGNRSYEFVMMYLSNMDDAGLMILPSHRLIKKHPAFQIESFFAKLNPWFEITGLPYRGPHHGESLLEFKRLLQEKGRVASTIGFHLQGHDQGYLMTLRPGIRDEIGPDIHPILKKLDVLVLSHLILQKALGFTKEDMDNETLFHYESDFVKAVRQVDAGAYQMAFLLNSTPMDHVKEVASNGLIMPRKSTYFYPKILTGLVFNKIDPYEVIQVP